jgi:predicted DNA binding CopG/RHH family protein
MKRKEPIPEFKSWEEEAEFWDTHDLSDYWDDFKPIKVRFAKNLSLSHGITVRLDSGTLIALRQAAKKMGIGPTTLARMWIIERLRKPAESKVSPPRRRRSA